MCEEMEYVGRNVLQLAVQLGHPQNDMDAGHKQSALDITGFAFGTCNWKQSVSTRWPGGGSGDTATILGQNPALEWNLQNRNAEVFTGCQRPVLTECDIKAIFAPAIMYKNDPVTAISLEIGLTSDIGIFVAIPQLRLLYKSLNSTLNFFQKFG